MRKLIESASVALGITAIYLLWLIGPLVSPRHATIYHWSGSASQLFLPPILDFCLLWVMLTLLLLFARRPGRLRVAVWSWAVFSTPWIALKTWVRVSEIKPPASLNDWLFSTALVATLLLVVFWRPTFAAKFETVVKIASTFLIFVSISGLAFLFELAWFGWQARSLNAQMPLHHSVASQSTSTGKPRIIWIVFDELSYEQLYERRFQGLQLPAFDQLASQSTVFTHVIPAGIRTAQILPSFMTGHPVDGSRSSADGRHLLLHNRNTKEWLEFDQHNSVFQDALNKGYSTAVVGWYNPYCRILPEVLDHCFWALGHTAATLQASMMGPLLYLAEGTSAYRLLPFFQVSKSVGLESESHIYDYQTLLKETDKVLDNRSANFVLLHLPVPHPDGIYNRATDKFAFSHSSYIDNLALADKCLAHIRSRMESGGEWDSSTVVVMGDHSWRTKLLWRSSPGWTEEDEVASQGGRFDDRPAYIVKLPQQSVGARIDTPFAAVNTRELLDALLAQNIRSTEDLSTWVSKDISAKGD
jgi:hypothetical protein